jgi:chemotaxis protein histidine kinase CheA
MIDFDDELAATFLAESQEHLATMEIDLLALEQGGAELDDELANRVFRAVHSIKGGASFFDDLTKIGELAHQMENILALVRSRAMVPTPDRVHVLLLAVDMLQRLIANPRASNQANIADITAALARLSSANPPSRAEQVGSFRRDRSHQSGMRLQMLLAEDDFTCRLLLQTFLSSYGECHIAVNGKEAVEAFRSASERGQRYDLICMDIMMPEMDGCEAVKQMRSIESAQGILSTYAARIIMTTTMCDIKLVIKCFQELCDAYLMKPIDLAELRKQMKAYQLIG